MAKPDLFTKSPTERRFLLPIFGPGVFLAEGETHRRMRKALARPCWSSLSPSLLVELPTADLPCSHDLLLRLPARPPARAGSVVLERQPQVAHAHLLCQGARARRAPGDRRGRRRRRDERPAEGRGQRRALAHAGGARPHRRGRCVPRTPTPSAALKADPLGRLLQASDSTLARSGRRRTRSPRLSATRSRRRPGAACSTSCSCSCRRCG